VCEFARLSGRASLDFPARRQISSLNTYRANRRRRCAGPFIARRWKNPSWLGRWTEARRVRQRVTLALPGSAYQLREYPKDTRLPPNHTIGSE
jgi:hypothetical protein